LCATLRPLMLWLCVLLQLLLLFSSVAILCCASNSPWKLEYHPCLGALTSGCLLPSGFAIRPQIDRVIFYLMSNAVVAFWANSVTRRWFCLTATPFICPFVINVPWIVFLWASPLRDSFDSAPTSIFRVAYSSQHRMGYAPSRTMTLA